MAKNGLSAKDFEFNFLKGADKLITDLTRSITKAAVGVIYERVVEVNPVLTGLSRFNWFVGVGEIPLQTTTEVAGVPITGSAMTSKERSRLEEAFAKIDSGDSGATVWIANSIPYVVYLDQGTSLKAPDGIAEVAILSALSGRLNVRLKELMGGLGN